MSKSPIITVRGIDYWRSAKEMAPKSDPWKQPCGEALVDWPRFSKYLLSGKKH